MPKIGELIDLYEVKRQVEKSSKNALVNHFTGWCKVDVSYIEDNGSSISTLINKPNSKLVD